MLQTLNSKIKTRTNRIHIGGKYALSNQCNLRDNKARFFVTDLFLKICLSAVENTKTLQINVSWLYLSKSIHFSLMT